jgi:hypothetical protein
MAAALDAVVLIHALGVAMRRIDESYPIWEDARASHHLVEAAQEIRISAIAWFEVIRGMNDKQVSTVATWRSRIFVQPIDGRTAQTCCRPVSGPEMRELRGSSLATATGKRHPDRGKRGCRCRG